MDVLRENQEMCLPIFSFSHYFDNSTNVPVHTHPATELIYQAGGQCTVTIGKEKFLCSPGDLLVIPPETAHNQISEGPVKTVFVTAVIDARLLSSRTRLIHFGNDPWTPRLMNMIQEMSREVRYELCGGVLYSLVRHIAQFERDQEFGTRNRIVTRAIKLIEANFNRPLNTKLIARSVGVSESYLRAVFLREKKISIFLFLQNYRMAHARRLLQQPYCDIKEVAFQCGYPDAGYFARQFKKIHLCSPTEFRFKLQTRPEFDLRL
ncbi:MAG TPA: AraC family transcriptional regulator [Victivallis vadensis]|nr:AraC family transcriptional regulator [Victivallis vadensis]